MRASRVVGPVGAGLLALLASCTGPSLLDPQAAVADFVGRGGQPTADDIAFLQGAWRRENERGVAVWEVWSRGPEGFVGEAWEANRGVSRLVERMQVVLTLDGWELRPVQFDQFERPYESEPFELTGWGADWVRFENPANRRPHTVVYRRVSSDVLEVWIVSAAGGGDERSTFRYRAMGEDGAVRRE